MEFNILARKSRFSVQVALGLVSLVVGRATFAEDDCGDVRALYDELMLSSTTQVDSTLFQAFCSDKAVLKKTDKNDGFELVLPELPVGLKGQSGYRQLSEMRANDCGESNHQFSEQKRIFLKERVVSKAVVEAWRDCMLGRINAESRGVHGKIFEMDQGGANFEYRVRWSPEHDNLPAPKITRFSVKGAECTPLVLSEGTRLSLETKIQTCTRDPHTAVQVTLHTTMGDISDKLEALPVPPEAQPLSPRERCLQGDLKVCREYVEAWRPPECKRPSPGLSGPVAAAEQEAYQRCQGNFLDRKSSIIDRLNYILPFQEQLMKDIQDIDKPPYFEAKPQD